MHSRTTPSSWDGRTLGGRFVGLAWPTRGEAGGVFAAAGDRGLVRVPVGRLADFLAAHPGVTFVVDLDGPHGLDVRDGAVDQVLTENRLFDVRLLSELVRLATPGVHRELPARPTGPDWAAYGTALRAEGARLARHASEAVARAGVTPDVVARFGPLGLGLDVRGAMAADRGGPGVRISDARRERVREALARRRGIAQSVLRDIPAAKEFANKPDGRGFLADGALRAESGALQTFVQSFIGKVRMRDGLPVPSPTGLADLSSWELLAPHDRGVAAVLELDSIHQFDTGLPEDGLIRPQTSSFPELRSVPDLGYLRRIAGREALAPARDGDVFVVIELPDLELRALAACLERRHGDAGLSRSLRHGRAGDVVLSVARAVSGLDVGEFIARMQTETGAVAAWKDLACLAWKYFPSGVANRALETWLAEYERGVRPSARQVADAWRACCASAPSLPDYCQTDVWRIVSGNLGVSPEELSRVLKKSDLPPLQPDAEPDLTAILEGVFEAGNGGTPGDRAFHLFRSEDWFPGNPVAARPTPTPTELVQSLLASEYATPVGRVFGEALPLQAVGRDHVELADAARKVAYHALVAGGFEVAGFAGDEFAVVVPNDGGARARAETAKGLVRHALVGWLDDVAVVVRATVAPLW